MGLDGVHQRIVRDPDGDPDLLAYAFDASPESVSTVINAKEGDLDGRSGWTWLRLENGDLMLGVFPRGETYFDCEVDAQLPFKEGTNGSP